MAWERVKERPIAPPRDTRKPPCDGCGAVSCFFLRANPMAPPELAVFLERWCPSCVPADWLPGRAA
jgi:hypothetical protein